MRDRRVETRQICPTSNLTRPHVIPWRRCVEKIPSSPRFPPVAKSSPESETEDNELQTMSDTNRTAFKPTRTSTRQSLSSSTSTKENNQQESISLVAALPLASAGMMRKGRSQSLGGAELLKRGRDDEELSPGKKSRRGLVRNKMFFLCIIPSPCLLLTVCTPFE